MLAFGVGILFFLAAAWYAQFLISPPVGSGGSAQKVIVDIRPGSTASQISRQLKDSGVIRSAVVFQWMARLLGETSDMKAGEYHLPRDLGAIEVLNRLVQGSAEQQWVVIPEGLTVRQIIERLDQRRLARVWEFERAVRRSPKHYGLDIPTSRASVDGFLMPDTYKFPVSATEGKIVKQMLDNWRAKVWEPHADLFAKSNLPVDKILVVASLIEREARVPQDRELISSVIRNRLKKKMKLQIDATVLYALGRHKSVVTYEDLKVKSPYNTYQNVGLPPGPICNPGLDSILAALKPADTDYLFYVAKPDGSHIFTRTGSEHEAAIKRVRQMKQAATPASAR